MSWLMYFVFRTFREEAQETVSLLEDSVKDVETERDQLKAKVEAMSTAAEEKTNVCHVYLIVGHMPSDICPPPPTNIGM